MIGENEIDMQSW